jgi:hypothetical protein
VDRCPPRFVSRRHATPRTQRCQSPARLVAKSPSESTIATQLGAIAGQVAASKDEASFAATAARLRMAAAVFGACGRRSRFAT